MVHWTHRSYLGRLAVAAVMAVSLISAGCKTVRGKGGDVETKPPIKATNARAQKRFDDAMALLKAGKYQQAREAFRLVQAEFGGDPIATLAELYVARASMGAVELQGSFTPEATAAYHGSAEAKRILSGLGSSSSVDNRIRYGAQAYLALELALRGKRGAALKSLDEYPSASVSNVVLDGDRLAVRALLTESFARAGRHADEIEAAARLYADVAPRIAAATQTAPKGAPKTAGADVESTGPAKAAAPASLLSLAALARDRALGAAESGIDEAALQEDLKAKLPLTRAAAGWGLLRARLGDDVTDDERPALEDLFNRVAPDLVAVGAAERAAELSKRLAAVGGPTRLAIGFLLPLSGPHRAIGQRAMAGALVAMRAFHHSGFPEVTLVFQDSQVDPRQAFASLERQKVLAVVGPLDVRRARQFAPLAEQEHIPMVTLTAGSAGDASAGQGASAAEQPDQVGFVFRNFMDATAEARASARIAFEQIGDRKAAIVYPSVGYGQVTSKAFADEFRRLGGQVVAQIPYDRSKSNFEPVAHQLAQAHPQAVFVPDSAEKVAEVTAFFANENVWGIAPDQKPSARSKRIQVHYLGTSLWENPILVRQAASYVDGAAIPVGFSTAFATPKVEQFVQRFEAIYGRKPENFEAFSFDTVMWLRELILDRGMGRAVAIRDALLAGDRHDGVTGAVHMTADGQPQRKLRFVTPTAEGFKPLPFTAATAVHTAPAQPDDAPGDAATNSADTTDKAPGKQGAQSPRGDGHAPPTKLPVQ